jgi:anti-sigma B factor antagonist
MWLSDSAALPLRQRSVTLTHLVRLLRGRNESFACLGVLSMAILIEEPVEGITRVVLSGRLDIAGASEIDLPLSVVGGTRQAVVVDLSAVTFMASLALRSVVLAGKAVLSKGGKFVLLSPQPAVEEVITVSGIDELFPIVLEFEEGVAAVRG